MMVDRDQLVKLFDDWWDEAGADLVSAIEGEYCEQHPDYDGEGGDASDGGCVHVMMHEGEAEGMTYDIALEAFIQGYRGEELDVDGLYCELDGVVGKAFSRGKCCVL